ASHCEVVAACRRSLRANAVTAATVLWSASSALRQSRRARSKANRVSSDAQRTPSHQNHFPHRCTQRTLLPYFAENSSATLSYNPPSFSSGGGACFSATSLLSVLTRIPNFLAVASRSRSYSTSESAARRVTSFSISTLSGGFGFGFGK